MGLPAKKDGWKVGVIDGTTVGDNVGTGVVLPARYVGSNEGNTVGEDDGDDVGRAVGLPAI